MKSTMLFLGLLLAVGAYALAVRNLARSATPGPSAVVSFAPAITLKSPVLYPSSIAAGDLNHDGVPDLAVVGIEWARLEHALGKGDGHFGKWDRAGAAGDAPGFVMFADVDLDGNLDAVSTSGDQPLINVAFGDGHGNFPDGEGISSGRGYDTQQVAVADLNGDGIPDIVGTSLGVAENPGNIFILLGKGHRKFAKAVNIGSGGFEPLTIAVVDLNHDNIPDLAVVNFGRQPPYGNVSVLLGKGDGTFAKPVPYLFGRYHDPFEVTLGDFNGDGNIDMAVTKGRSNSVHVLLGRGDGTFLPSKPFFVGSDGAGTLAAADFNGDGVLDLAVTSCSVPEPCHVAVLLGNGDGTFQAPVHFHVGVGPLQLAIADYNHDGKPDIATINNGDSTISILLNTTP